MAGGLRDTELRVRFSKGLSTLTDEKTVVPGELTDAQNSRFTKESTLSKRWGTQPLDRTRSDAGYAAVHGCRGGGSRGDDTVLVTDDDELVSYTDRGWSLRGHVTPMECSIRAFAKGPYEQYDQTTALAPNGVRICAWADGGGGVRMRFFDEVSGSGDLIPVDRDQVVGGGGLSRQVRCHVVGSNFHTYFVSGSTLNVATVPCSQPTTSPTYVQLGTGISPTAPDDGPYDVVVRGSNALVAYRTTDCRTIVSYVRQNGAVATSGTFPPLPSQFTLPAFATFGPALALTPDLGQLVIAYGNDFGGIQPQVNVTVLNAIDFSAFQSNVNVDLPGTAQVSSGTLKGLTVVVDPVQVSGNLGQVYPYTVLYEVAAQTPTDRLVRYAKSTLDTSATHTSGTFRRHATVASHAFSVDGDPYVWLNYPSDLQGTDFLYAVRDNRLCAVSRYGQCTPNVSGTLERPQVAGTTVYRAAPHREQVPTVSTTGSAFEERSSRIMTTAFHASGAFAPVDVEGVLYFGGGQLGMYDGSSVIEHGFHLLSEPLVLVPMSGATGLTGMQDSVISGTYSYVAVPAWSDSRGNVYRGFAVAGATGITLDTNHNQVAITGSMLSHTLKDGSNAYDLNWELYRTVVNDSSAWQRVDDPRSPIVNSTASDHWTFLDAVTDVELESRQVLYAYPFGGGELANLNVPACSVLALSEDRLLVAGLEGDPLTVACSKLRLGGSVEFGLGAQFSVDPVGGPITALSPLDDHLIVAKAGRLYLADGFPQTNEATDTTGYPVPTLITSQVGCPDTHTIVQVAGTQAQGIMFKSEQGIRLLDRGLQVHDIGDRVRAYDGLDTVAAVADPLTQQVRFFSVDGTTLVYDARVLQWSRNTTQPAIDAFVHRGVVAYVDSLGRVNVEIPGSYLDGYSPYSQVIELGWIELGGLQGLHRVRALQVLGNKVSDHTFRVEMAFDFKDSYVVRDIPTTLSMGDSGYGSEPYGTGPYGGGGDSLFQHGVSTPVQRVQAIRLRFSDIEISGSGGGFELTELSLKVAVDKTWAQLPGRKRY